VHITLPVKFYVVVERGGEQQIISTFNQRFSEDFLHCCPGSWTLENV